MPSADLTLPGLDRTVAPLGVGTWAWGDKKTWGMGGYDASFTEGTIAGAWEASIEAGATFFDTAEIYGGGESERIIGRLLAADPGRRDQITIATKFMPAPWKLDVKSALRSALEGSLERLGIDAVDLYQIHGPISLRSHKVMAEALAAVHDTGLVRAVGVSNYSVREMRSIHTELAVRDLPLATNQIEFSLLRQRPLTSGLLDACTDLGVVPLAYSPIGQGRLTGKYSASNPPIGRRNFGAHPMELADAIVAKLKAIGEPVDRTPAQVALRWLIQHGTIPIPGAKNAEQASQNAGALGWELTDQQMGVLDAAALEGTTTLAGRIWQHG